MHSVAMSPAATSRAGSRSTAFVRLSQLRKLRDCEQVAAVCYRIRRGAIEFLLIQTRGSGRWTFPKGSTEPGLTHAQAAAMEAFEEAGVHGRIEEDSFASYLRRQRERTQTRVKGGAETVAVKAYLCHVLRLGVPKESNRNRTWFSAEKARESLKDGRDVAEGASLARILRLAVVRIHRLERENIIRPRQDAERIRSERLSSPSDPLHKVKFEFAEVYGRAQAGCDLPRPQASGAAHRYALPAAAVHRTEPLRGDILEFDVSQKKRVKALASGSHQK